MTALAEVNMDVLRRSLEGIVPSVLSTCDAERVPNVSLISQVHYVDRAHVALSYQFFNKTRQNLLQTHCASVAIVDPVTMAQHRLSLDYVETRTDGPVFESMRARLSGIASHVGMSKVFRLLGSDIFRGSRGRGDPDPNPARALSPARPAVRRRAAPIARSPPPTISASCSTGCWPASTAISASAGRWR